MYDGDIQMTKKNRINIRNFFFVYLLLKLNYSLFTFLSLSEATTTEPEVTKPSC